MGKQSGKLGQSVLSTRYGEQIQRAYVKEIANPKTEAQVATRSRFKLASQLSAAMADVIAIPRVGSKTGRNQFVSATMDITNETAGVAQVDLNAVQLTKSQRGLIGFTATRDQAGNKISIALKGANGSAISRVVYVAFEKQSDGSLVQFDSKVISEAGADNTFPAELKFTANSVVLYSYGITDKDGATSVKFGNLDAPTAEQVAKLVTTSSDTLSGVTLTKTNGATMNIGYNACDSDTAQPLTDVVFTDVTAGGIAWTANLHEQTAGTKSVEGNVINVPLNMVMGLILDDIYAPVIGTSYENVARGVIYNRETGYFGFTFNALNASRYYMVIGVPNGTSITPAYVYEFNLQTEDVEP